MISPRGDLGSVFASSDSDLRLWAIDIRRYRGDVALSTVRMYLRQDLTPGLNIHLQNNASIYSALASNYGITPDASAPFARL